MCVVYVDMDETLNFYRKHFYRTLRANPEVEYPQSLEGFYLGIEPRLDGIAAVKDMVSKGIDVYIASRPSFPNKHCYTEKALWTEKWLGSSFVEKLILIPNKNLLIGDYLIDDYPWNGFKGSLKLFDDNWEQITKEIYAELDSSTILPLLYDKE